jgi:SH3-like domain-containing protein
MNQSIQTLALVSFLIAGQASAACINVPEANLRKGPGTQHEKSWQVYKYMPLKQLEQAEDWVQVEDVDGDKHWVFGKLLSDKYQCAVVKVNKATVRSGPGINFGKTPLGLVEKYYAFKIIGEDGDWWQVEDEVDNQGWIHKKLLWAH